MVWITAVRKMVWITANPFLFYEAVCHLNIYLGTVIQKFAVMVCNIEQNPFKFA